MTHATTEVPYRVGHWLPSDQAVLDAWLKERIDAVECAPPKPLLPIIQEFKDLIESDAEIYMLFNQMFSQVPSKPPYNKNPALQPQVRNYEQMLALLNGIMTHTPTFNTTGVVGFPINAILDWSMGTEGGYAAFLNDKVNAMLTKVLNEWGVFLKSPNSATAINDNAEAGWLGDEAMLAMVKMLPAVPGSGGEPYWKQHDLTPAKAKKVFIETFNCDPEAERWGFTSWDDFFLRTFRPGQRPVGAPGDDSVVVNACESAPYNKVEGVNLRDKFWIKGQPYSLSHMLNGDEYVERFVGGTVYQAFLSAKSYHRWHSPITGTVVKTHSQTGTYYSEIPSEGFYNPVHTDDTGGSSQVPDPAGPNDSQGYISEVATRAMIYIEAKDPALGLVCFMPIGMAEVSSCEVTAFEGQEVEKGDPVGMFHFGGSSHCLIFEPKVKLDFHLHGQKPSLDAHNLAVRDTLATLA